MVKICIIIVIVILAHNSSKYVMSFPGIFLLNFVGSVDDKIKAKLPIVRPVIIETACNIFEIISFIGLKINLWLRQ